MSSLPAFYLPEWGSEPVLENDEARHANVLRLKAGEEIMIMDGRGKSGRCRIKKIGKKNLDLELLREWRTPRPASRPIIAIALSKAARRGFFLEKAAELGAWAIWLWDAERSQGEIGEKLAQSCRAQINAGAKQCHNPWFPELVILGKVDKLATRAQSCDWRILPWEAKAGEPVISLAQLGLPGETVYALGPEGGLADWEAGCLVDAGFAPTSLGDRLLRCETAATLCLGLHWWASQLPDGKRE